MTLLNHLLVAIRIRELAREAEYQRLVKVARSAPPTERYSPPLAAHHAHYHVIRRVEPRTLSIQSVRRHRRAA